MNQHQNQNHAIAVISDIHSNVFALEAVLQDIGARGIQTIVNLGDALFGPIAPVQTAELLMRRTDVVHIMGNCDRYLLEEELDSPTFQHVKPLLRQDVLDWLRTFRKQWVYEDLLFCHGTPFADDEYLMERVAPYGTDEKSVTELMIELANVPQNVIFCGHTHVHRSVWLPDGKWIVNPGSVGLPAYFEEKPHPHFMESLTPHAKYATATRQGDSWKVEHILLPYDYEKAAKLAEEAGRMDYAHAIRTGRARL
ncbi:metallophosphoesterase family protein [Brevibacillus agri]|uniref:metallophosphoesterase family protein n=1 Tax=Brevibacillus agri TaxID=51101 RepID=UPI0002A5233F|nr:metallophosphoesterase family protein [Brevibacillus agri]ELK41912.1 hypothetical protein D478_11592 [Brevibacillus agri BAB-2500]MCG5254042.1 metallophosphatase family protein [Brevibacillus agri]MDN4096241.1 metallophosphoesterase family protein [Brevibacillus agri]